MYEKATGHINAIDSVYKWRTVILILLEKGLNNLFSYVHVHCSYTPVLQNKQVIPIFLCILTQFLYKTNIALD